MAKQVDLTPFKEALKEALRVVIFALLSWGIARLSALPETEVTMVGTILLKALDKWLHKKDINIYEKVGLDETKGLLPV